MAPELPPVAELVPHAGSMLWLRRVIAHSDDETECETDVAALALLCAADGSAPAYAALEVAAQCVSAHARLAAPASGPPRIGLLLGTRRFELPAARLARGQVLRVRARRLWGANLGPAAFEVEVRDAATDRVVASGRLSCFTPSSSSE